MKPRVVNFPIVNLESQTRPLTTANRSTPAAPPASAADRWAGPKPRACGPASNMLPMPSASASAANRPTIAAKPVASAADRWAAAVKSCGSIRAAVRQHPALHQAYIDAINAPRTSASMSTFPPTAKPVASATNITGDVKSQWAAAVQSCGSISKAVKQHPELHQAYIDAINAPRTSSLASEAAKTKARIAAMKH